jgi:hypothetical protein
MPRVVTAGVPMRMPLVTNGDCVSKGTVFLLTVIPARSSAFSATLPVSPLAAQVHQHEVVVGAARDDVEAALRERRGQRLRVGDHLPAVGGELGAQRLAEGHRLGGDHVLSGPPCRPGNIALSIFLRVLVVAEDHAAARAAQRLVRGRGHHVGVRHRRRVHARRRRARRSAPCPP